MYHEDTSEHLASKSMLLQEKVHCWLVKLKKDNVMSEGEMCAVWKLLYQSGQITMKLQIRLTVW